MVRERVRELLAGKGASAVVSSAACGADLIGLGEAGTLGIRRRVVLPFGRGRFRETSVMDRPGDWGAVYDRILDQVEAVGDLLVLDIASEDDPYAAANSVILDDAVALAKAADEPAGAVLVWDGVSRGDGDLTEDFGVQARKRGLPVMEVLTI